VADADAVPIPAWMGDVRAEDLGFPFPVDRSRYRKETGIPYKETAEGPLHLDAYRPARPEAPGGAPLVVMIHGGGWQGGGRYAMGLTRWAGYLASAGLAVVSIDYRLAPATTYPDSFGDCLDAVDWAVANAGRLGADPARVGLWGDSAGGHLALLLATSQTRGDVGGPRLACGGGRLRAVAAWYPPTDLPALHEAEAGAGGTVVRQFVGADPEAAPARWREASPIHQVHPEAPPTLLLQGTRDLLVPAAQATRYAERAAEVGAACELHVVEGAVHGFDRVAPGAEARARIERCRAFLLDVLAG
jgi:acetyl esterase/lipase